MTPILSFLIWLDSALGGTLVGVAVKWAASKLLGKPLDEVTQTVESAIDSAQIKFHERYADAFGPSGSTFIDSEHNRKALLCSTFSSGKRLAANDIDPHGFDRAPNASAEAVEFFLQAFYGMLYQTESRDLDRDQSLQEATRKRDKIHKDLLQIDTKVGDTKQKLDNLIRARVFPEPVRAAIAQPHLDELTELMKAGRAQETFDFAIQHTEKIDAALTKENDPEGLCAEALRTYRQRLLFAATSAASWLGRH